MRIIFFVIGLLLGAGSLYLLSLAIIRGGGAMIPLFVLGGSLFVSATLFVTAAGIIDAIKTKK
jgi:uncharacterized membrane protein YgdD (TMEM256/DUF423 family)